MTVRGLQLLLAIGALLGPACSYMPTQPRPTVAVSGRISDQAGRPLHGVRVDFFPGSTALEAFYGRKSTTTDSTGAFSLGLVAGVWEMYVHPPPDVSLPGEYVGTRVTISPEHRTLNVVVQGFRIRGRVLTPSGVPLDSASVGAEGVDSETDELAFAFTAFENGSFSLLVPAGIYSFGASPRGAFSGLPSRTITGVSVVADTTFDIVLQGDLLEGLVAGPGGMPLEGVEVTASGEVVFSRARTGPDGRYALYAPPGDYRFFCQPGSDEAYILTRISSQRSISGPATIDFDLSGTEWTGTVRSSATNQPISGVSVRAELFADDYDRAAVATTDGAGQFRLVLERNREYSLAFSESAVVGLTIPSIFAAADTTFDIVLDPAPTP